jgi:hypothetical protein
MIGPAPPAIEPPIQAALDAIYSLFSAPTPRVIEGCPCCVGSRGVDVLLNTPLRALTGDALWRYVTGAFLTVGSERDFRYLLPRILELAVCDPGALPDVEIVLGKTAARRLVRLVAARTTRHRTSDRSLVRSRACA